MYCGVPGKAPDEEHESLGGVFPLPLADVGRVGRLSGIDGVQKMSKSLGNAIYIRDTAKQVKKKIGRIYTGHDSRQPTEPGEIDPEKNPLFQYVETFIDDENLVADFRDRYSRGANIGDGEVKVAVSDAINQLLEPMQERREQFSSDDDVIDILREGTGRANSIAEETLALAKEAASLKFFNRTISLQGL
jgi:tryptophanyl-tRNA synthetase